MILNYLIGRFQQWRQHWLNRKLIAASTEGAYADANAVAHDGQTPLIIAASLGRADYVRQLLDHGADIGAQNQRGKTAIMEAVMNGCDEVIQMLQQAGARKRR